MHIQSSHTQGGSFPHLEPTGPLGFLVASSHQEGVDQGERAAGSFPGGVGPSTSCATLSKSLNHSDLVFPLV